MKEARAFKTASGPERSLPRPRARRDRTPAFLAHPVFAYWARPNRMTEPASRKEKRRFRGVGRRWFAFPGCRGRRPLGYGHEVRKNQEHRARKTSGRAGHQRQEDSLDASHNEQSGRSRMVGQTSSALRRWAVFNGVRPTTCLLSLGPCPCVRKRTGLAEYPATRRHRPWKPL